MKLLTANRTVTVKRHIRQFLHEAKLCKLGGAARFCRSGPNSLSSDSDNSGFRQKKYRTVMSTGTGIKKPVLQIRSFLVGSWSNTIPHCVDFIRKASKFHTQIFIRTAYTMLWVFFRTFFKICYVTSRIRIRIWYYIWRSNPSPVQRDRIRNTAKSSSVRSVSGGVGWLPYLNPAKIGKSYKRKRRPIWFVHLIAFIIFGTKLTASVGAGGWSCPAADCWFDGVGSCWVTTI